MTVERFLPVLLGQCKPNGRGGFDQRSLIRYWPPRSKCDRPGRRTAARERLACCVGCVERVPSGQDFVHKSFDYYSVISRPDGPGAKLPSRYTDFSAEVGGFHYSTQLFVEVRRDCVTVVQLVGGDGELCVRVEDDEVCVAASFECPYPMVDSGQSCRGAAHPTDDVVEGEAPIAALRVDD